VNYRDLSTAAPDLWPVAQCSVGFVGNTVSVLCLRSDKSKTPTPQLLIALELADTAFLATVFLLRVLTSVQTRVEHALDPSMDWIGLNW